MLAGACTVVFMWKAVGCGRERQTPHTKPSVVSPQAGSPQGRREEEVCSRSGYYGLSDQSQIFAVSEGSPPP